MKEKDIVNAIKRALTMKGAWVIKTHGSLHLAGLPDILGCVRGYFIGIEVKTPTTRGTVTPRQEAFLAAISEAGGITGVATSVTEALEIVDQGLDRRTGYGL